MKGRVSSLQSLGTVDGPGLRYVIFLQGCPLRCVYCHNPETWDPAGGREYAPEELVEKVLRCRAYFGEQGGVTVSGGEPLLQAPFVAELFRQLKAAGSTPPWTPPGPGTCNRPPRSWTGPTWCCWT